MGITKIQVAGEPIPLNLPCGLNPAPYYHAALSFGGIVQFKIMHPGNFDLQIETVQQGTGNSGLVAVNLKRTATASLAGIAKETARTRVQRISLVLLKKLCRCLHPIECLIPYLLRLTESDLFDIKKIGLLPN
jgi:hypothetical protein